MNTVSIDGVTRELPSSWNELSSRQLLVACRLIIRHVPVTEFKVKVLFQFLSVRKKLFRKIDPEDVLFLSETFSFLQDQVSLTRALIPSIRVNRFPWRKLYGPSDAMKSCTFGEFTKAQIRFEAYNKSQDPQLLDEMVAVLFRPRKSFWWIRRNFGESTDPRVRFLDRTLHGRAKQMAGVDPAIKYAVQLFFSGVQSAIAEKFPNVYRHDHSETSSSGNGWISLVISLADGKTDDQSLDRVMNSNLYNVFFGLEKKSIEYFELLAKYEKND